ncbi:MAG: addiction module protein [Roseimicrobium sp.]
MTVTLPLAEMSFREKLDVIELVLADLAGEEAQVPLPEWHADLLDERQARIDRSEERFTNWETAKAEIWMRCH